MTADERLPSRCCYCGREKWRHSPIEDFPCGTQTSNEHVQFLRSILASTLSSDLSRGFQGCIDEIDRLQREAEWHAGNTELNQKLLRENDRLQRELKSADEIIIAAQNEGVRLMHKNKELQQEIEAANTVEDTHQQIIEDTEAERDRLRVALERIAAPHDCGCRPCHCFDSAERMMVEYNGQRELAREALGPAQETAAARCNCADSSAGECPVHQ